MSHFSRPVTVLVTGSGGAAGVAVVRSLLAAGHRVISADCDPFAAGLYLVPEEDRVVLPRGDAPDFADRLLEEAVDRGVDVVIPTVDEELIVASRRRSAFYGAGVTVLVSATAALEGCLDKWRLIRLLEHVVPVPDSVLLDDAFDASARVYPLLVKPRTGRGGRGVTVVHDPAEIERMPCDGSLLVQEFLPGEEYSVDVLVDHSGRARASVPRLRIRIDSGVAVVARTVRDAELEAYGVAAATAAGIWGPANVQFRRDADGTPRLLEINPRFPGTLGVTIAAGVDLPALALADALGEPLASECGEFEEVGIVRFLDELVVPVAQLGEPRAWQSPVAA